jgi:hypothetical protein
LEENAVNTPHSLAQNPLAWTTETDQSPEGEAFVLLLEAAWRDWRSM